MAKRLPCPFCGSKSVRSSHALAFYVVCDNCDAFGPTEEGPGSGELWNKRVASPPVAVQEERDAKRLAFLCDPKEGRYIEEERGMWRVYHDIAPVEAAQHDWRAMTSKFYPSASEAIDAAMQGDQP